MSDMHQAAVSTRRRMRFSVAASVVVGLWTPYAALNMLYPGPIATYALGLALALVSLYALWLAGVPPPESFVRLAPLSWRGAVSLALLALFIPAVLLGGHSWRWDWRGDLIYAPASALAQELYFRGALLATLARLFPASRWLALLGQAVLFALWHVRAFRVVAPGPALAVLAGTLVAGLLWGWQAARDRTLLYAILEHTLFLMVK